jgi:hypothetical protein
MELLCVRSGPALLNSFAKMCSSSLDCTHHKILLDKEKHKVYVKLSDNFDYLMKYAVTKCSRLPFHKIIIASSTTAWKLLKPLPR